MKLLILKAFATIGQALRVDMAKRLIIGFAVATKGPAEGHDVELDDETMRQIIAEGNSKPIRCRINHPDQQRDDEGDTFTPVANKVEVLVGFATNFRLSEDGQKVLADCKILSPDAAPKGNQILALANEAPEIFGASMVFSGQAIKGKSRVAELYSIDFVDVPAANPAGLFGAKPPKQGVKTMALRAFLEGGKAYTEVEGEKHELLMPEGYSVQMEAEEEEGTEKDAKKKTKERESAADDGAGDKTESNAAKGGGKTYEEGVKAERQYATDFQTALDAAKITGPAAAELRKTHYGRPIEDIKFLASHAIGERAKPVGESAGGTEQTEDQKVEAEATQAFKTNAATRHNFAPALRYHDSENSDEYKNALRRYVALAVKNHNENKPENKKKALHAFSQA